MAWCNKFWCSISQPISPWTVDSCCVISQCCMTVVLALKLTDKSLQNKASNVTTEHNYSLRAECVRKHCFSSLLSRKIHQCYIAKKDLDNKVQSTTHLLPITKTKPNTCYILQQCEYAVLCIHWQNHLVQKQMIKKYTHRHWWKQYTAGILAFYSQLLQAPTVTLQVQQRFTANLHMNSSTWRIQMRFTANSTDQQYIQQQAFRHQPCFPKPGVCIFCQGRKPLNS